MLSEDFVAVRDIVARTNEETDYRGSDPSRTVRHLSRVAESGGVRKVGNWVAATNITAKGNISLALEDEVRDCFEQLQGEVDIESTIPHTDNRHRAFGRARDNPVQLRQY